MMRTTYPEAYFNFIDTSALEDGAVSSSYAGSLSSMSLFAQDASQPVYGSCELNQFLLDGSRSILPAGKPSDVPFWSSTESGADCLYAINPTLQIVFSQAHSSIGLNLYFPEDVPAEIRITWSTLQGTKLDEDIFYPDAKEYFCEKNVQDYGKIEIEFVRSTLPYRCAKMDHIQYGRMMTMSRSVIKKASVYEDIDITSATLPINTASIDIIDTDDDFNLSDATGLWKSLQQEQEIKLVEYIDGQEVDCGTFFLSDWSASQNKISMSFVDAIGTMDKTKYYEGAVYSQVKAGTIIASIMESAGIEKYSVDEDVYNTLVSGWLGIQTHRQALQQVMFACGSVADCSRSDYVKIYKPDRYVNRTIERNNKFLGTKITLDQYISSVTVAFSAYKLASSSDQITQGTFPAGQSRIEFSDPYLPSSISVSGGSLIQASCNYAIISMAREGECTLAGRKYEETENAYTAAVDTLSSGERPQTKEYKGCTLVDSARAKAAAEYILDYCKLQQVVSMRYINCGEAVGNWCNVADAKNGYSITGITNQTLDLTGGNIATATCRGYSKVTTYLFYTGEIYAGELGVM